MYHHLGETRNSFRVDNPSASFKFLINQKYRNQARLFEIITYIRIEFDGLAGKRGFGLLRSS
jgi:hypothetical protein